MLYISPIYGSLNELEFLNSFILIINTNSMKVAVVQFKASTNKETNLKKIIKFISKAAKNKAALVAFPEFMMFYTNSSQTSKQLASLAETIKGNFVTTIANTAKENKIQVIGSFYEKSTKKIGSMTLHL